MGILRHKRLRSNVKSFADPFLDFRRHLKQRIAISSRKLTSTVANEADAIIVYGIEIKIILVPLRLGENVVTYPCLNLSESQRYVSSKL
jgi:hypothetical protein